MQPSFYRGRFAPTPSGPLHLGSLLTALASYLQARAARGRWLLRIDDLDQPRVARAAESRILSQLEAHGLHWDESPRRQTEHNDEYAEAVQTLKARGQVYACRCTRAALATQSLPGPDGPVYAGTCRNMALPWEGSATRLRVPDEELIFRDGWRDWQRRHLFADVGDIVVQRRDGVFAYQLACAVDEHAQGITEVVRGVDLLGSTFRQLHIMRLLRLREPQYRHLPILVDSQQRKLSKQNHALAIDEAQAGANLVHCLDWLGQNPPPALARAGTDEILQWAQARWSASEVPNRHEIEARSL